MQRLNCCLKVKSTNQAGLQQIFFGIINESIDQFLINRESDVLISIPFSKKNGTLGLIENVDNVQT